MQKWVRRSLHATLAVGAIGLCSANLANAEEPRIHVDSTSTSVVGDNGVGSGNALSVPVVAGVLDNQVALSHILLVGLGDALNLGPGGDCSVVVDSSATSMAGNNQVAGANAVSAPVVAVVAGNEVASTILGDSFNSGEACDGGGDGGYENGPVIASQPEMSSEAELSSESDFNEEFLPIGGLGGLTGALPLDAVTGLVGNLPLGALTGILGGLPLGDVAGTLPLGGLGGVLGNPTALIGTVSSLAGLGGLGGLPLAGLTGMLPLDTVTGALPLGSLPLVGGLAPASAPAISDIVTGEQASDLGLQNETAELQSNSTVVTEFANGGSGSGGMISVTSEAVSVAGNNTILSGNSASVPVVAGVLDNQIAAAVLGDAVNQGAGGGDLLGLLDGLFE